MWKSKKFIIVVSLVSVLLIGITGVAVLADDDNEQTTRKGEFVNRVCEIYERETGDVIEDPDALVASFKEAGEELQKEVRDAFIQKMIDEGKITEEQAEEYKEWLNAKPDDFPLKFAARAHKKLSQFPGARCPDF
jgi:hypothetical protein